MTCTRYVSYAIYNIAVEQESLYLSFSIDEQILIQMVGFFARPYNFMRNYEKNHISSSSNLLYLCNYI